ncbi:glycoside hydrolase family 25 protein [Pedobacter petrophilus]|uniref:Glycoside hydrolase family 25 protein n=1 Tax=Pedobacter petrophilus TaxID=1908241 RepID=A0A7K0FU80_9SPHI|nr:glycoside hydrolase family 25 protein [Pedobacter petrophilus]MRX75167.1 glycoside hydrolase family 25 protein [Pedobacter petrophilus]
MPPEKRIPSDKKTVARKPVERKPTSRKPVGKRKKQSFLSAKMKVAIAALLLILLSPLYYGYVLNGFVATWRWMKDLGQDPNYRTYKSFNIKIPKKYSIHGIDVSYYQGKINWPKVKAMKEDEVKISFAFIKATEGILQVDPYFQRNWREAPKAGIVCGAYHFFRPKKSGSAQAKFFLQVANVEKGDLPPVVDVETLDGVTPLRMRLELSDFLTYVEMKTGVRPIIYTGLKFYEDNLKGKLDEYPLWIAHYYQPRLRLDKSRWKFWQHSDKAKINGIGHVVDFNAFNGDSTTLAEMLVK